MKRSTLAALLLIAIGCGESKPTVEKLQNEYGAKIVVNREVPDIGYIAFAVLKDQTKVWRSSGKSYTRTVKGRTEVEAIQNLTPLMQMGIKNKAAS